MAKPQAKTRPTSRKRDRRQSTGAFWFLLGTLVGAFGVGFAWMNAERTPSAPGEQAAEATKPTTKPTFDFYERLPQDEVLVPIEQPARVETPLPAAPKPEPPPPAATTKAPAPQAPAQAATAAAPPPTPQAERAPSYRLQVGSFSDAADAERRKAELALLGVSVDIEKADVGGAERFRLRTGVLEQPAAEALGRKLKAQGVSSMAIKQR